LRSRLIFVVLSKIGLRDPIPPTDGRPDVAPLCRGDAYTAYATMQLETKQEMS